MNYLIKNNLLLFLFLFSGCLVSSPFSHKRYMKEKQQKYLTVSKAEKTSQCNRCFKKGYNRGFDKAYDVGFKEGKRLGEKKGEARGIRIGIDSLIREIEKYKDKDTLYLALILGTYYHKHAKDLKYARDQARDAGREECRDKYYALGFEFGYAQAFDSLYNIWVNRAQIAQINPEPKVNLVLNYDKIAARLSRIENGNTVDFINFSHALKTVHTEILTYITVLVEFTNKQETEIFEFYEEMHPRLAKLYYKKYIRQCQTQNRNYNKSFYDYRYHTSVSNFIQTISMGICSITDRLVTFSKNSTQFAPVEGFDAMGHICEIIMEKIIVPLEDHFLKNAIRIDYDITLSQIRQTAAQILTSEIAEVRKDSKKITETFSPSSGVNVDIEMEIVTIIELGFDVDNLTISVDHKNQQFNTSLTRSPRFIRTIYQDYKVLSVKSRISRNPISNYKKFNITEKKLKQIFEAHKGNPTALDIIHKPLKKQVSSKLIPILTKIFEPCVILPYSCYSANMKFGNYSQELIAIKCR